MESSVHDVEKAVEATQSPGMPGMITAFSAYVYHSHNMG